MGVSWPTDSSSLVVVVYGVEGMIFHGCSILLTDGGFVFFSCKLPFIICISPREDNDTAKLFISSSSFFAHKKSQITLSSHTLRRLHNQMKP